MRVSSAVPPDIAEYPAQPASGQRELYIPFWHFLRTGVNIGALPRIPGHRVAPLPQAIVRLRYGVAKLCWRWLSRRSRKSRVNWERMTELLRQHPLPPANVVRSLYAT